MDWPFTLQRVLAQKPCVLITLNLILGSAPRESGCRMIVTAEDVHGSIGGGNLEFTAIAEARSMLNESGASRQTHRPYGLGPALNQCCGGAVTVLFEVLPAAEPEWLTRLVNTLERREPAILAMAIDRAEPFRKVVCPPQTGLGDLPGEVVDACRQLLANGPDRPVPAGTDLPRESEAAALPAVALDDDTWWLEPLAAARIPLYLFGAGHVGKEAARLFERLPFDVTWIDSRAEVFEKENGCPHTRRQADDVAAEVHAAPANCLFVVMTHSHQLDEDICFEILKRNEFNWLGLIGSGTKRRRFDHRLVKRGIPESRLARLICPIGLDGIRGKQPATIALSLAAQLMMERPWIHASN